jgi:hypothetical protein
LSLDQPVLKETVNQLKNAPTANRSLGTALKEGSKTALSIRNPRDLAKVLEFVGQASEQPTRLAVFKSALDKGLKQGLSREEAARSAATAAQDATVNFARRGSKTQSVNMLYAFMNARAQGVDQLFRSAKKNPAGVGTRLGLVAMAPAIASYMHNRSYPGYNDPRIISDYDKQNNFVWMISNDRYIKIPKGDVGKLANPVEAFLSHMDGKGGSVSQQLVTALKAFSPAQNIGDVIPTSIRPVVENAANKNFFTGNSIVPDYKKGFPAAKQDNPSTSPIYRALGQQINQSPARLQNLTEGYLTGFAKIGENVTQPLLQTQYGKPRNEQGDKINTTPIIRRFVGGAKMSQEEYDLAKQKQAKSIQFDINDIKSGIKRGDLTPEEGAAQIEKLKGLQADKLSGNNVAHAAENGKTPSRYDSVKDPTLARAQFNQDVARLRTNKAAIPFIIDTYKNRIDDLANLQRSLNPKIDQAAITRNETEIEKLTQAVQKYNKQGGFTKPKAAKKGRSGAKAKKQKIVKVTRVTTKARKISVPRVTVAKTKQIRVTAPRVKSVKFKLPSTKGAHGRKIRVSRR